MGYVNPSGIDSKKAICRIVGMDPKQVNSIAVPEFQDGVCIRLCAVSIDDQLRLIIGPFDVEFAIWCRCANAHMTLAR